MRLFRLNLRGGSGTGLLVLVGVLFFASPARSATPAAIDLNRFDASKHSVVLSNGIRLAYVQMGDAKGQAVVLIHGYTDNARDWVPLIPYLPGRYRLVIVDIRGHGQSSKPECCYTRLDFAYDVKLLLDRLKIQQADIVGHSLGSIIAQTFAETWPERTRKVILISSTGGPRPGTPSESHIRLCIADSPAQGADRPGLAFHDRLVVLADPRRRGLHPPPAGRLGAHSAASLAGRAGPGLERHGSAIDLAPPEGTHPVDLGPDRSDHGRGRSSNLA